MLRIGRELPIQHVAPERKYTVSVVHPLTAVIGMGEGRREEGFFPAGDRYHIDLLRYVCGTDANLPYAQVKSNFLILAGCVKADTPTNTAEELLNDSKTNDHPATAADRGR